MIVGRLYACHAFTSPVKSNRELDHSRGPPPSWSTFHHAMTTVFTKRGGTVRADTLFRKRRMQAGESVDSYLFDITFMQTY